MPNEPKWLTYDHAIFINLNEVQETGENHSIINPGNLKSAIARPQWLWKYKETDIGQLTGSLISGLAQAHGFEQGNKRTAWVGGLTFAAMNGYMYGERDSEGPGRMVEALVKHQISEQYFKDWISALLIPVR